MTRSWLFHPQEFAVCGYRGSGKTTLLQKMTSALVARDLAVAYLKHDAHHFDLDREGKDTDLLSKEGARPVLIHSARASAKLQGQGVDGSADGKPSPLAAFDTLDADLLLVEGFKNAGLPRLAMLDTELSLLKDPCWKDGDPVALAGPWNQEPEALTAWRGAVEGDRSQHSVPYFHRDAVDSIEDWLRSRIAAQVAKRPLLGLVLSGGRSQRMGTDKGELSFGRGTQLDKACSLLQELCREVHVSCRPDQIDSPSRSDKRLLVDRFLGFGPLGGILTAMHTRPEAAWLVLACDLPFLDEELLRGLLRARDGLRLATAYAASDGMPEPMCAIWEPHALPRLHQLLGLGFDCPRKTLMRSRIRLVHAAEPARLENVNERSRFDEIAAKASGKASPPATLPTGPALLSVAELDRLLDDIKLPPLPIERVDSHRACGRVLAETIAADMDQPPFHRAAMDGLALRAGIAIRNQPPCYWTSRRVRAAGDAWAAKDDEDVCEIMTGASMPVGFDTVIPYEDLQELDGGGAGSTTRRFALLPSVRVRPGQNVHGRASDYRAGEILLAPKVRLCSADVHTLVSAGHKQVAVRRRPSIGILATGSEIVDGEAHLGPSSIRASNHLALAAELQAAGFGEVEARCCADDETRLTREIKDLLGKHQVVLVTGGVSKGRFDFVPRILHELGVVTLAHGVALKPGKPLLVGTFKHRAQPGADANHTTGVPVFGLPGNPVSSLILFRRFVLPLLRHWEGCPEEPIFLPLAGDEPVAGKLTRFLPVRTCQGAGALELHRLPEAGSGCFRQLVGSQGIAELPWTQQSPRRDAAGRMLLRWWPWAGAMG
jgi:molybdopterin-guanine dinucleotide biosynthesis protein A